MKHLINQLYIKKSNIKQYIDEILSESNKDDFWGAYEIDKSLIGANILGRLLCSLRTEYREYSKKNLKSITLGALDIPNFKLLNSEVGNLTIDITKNYNIGENYSIYDFLE